MNKNSNVTSKSKEFIAVCDAYKVLGKPESRAVYDRNFVTGVNNYEVYTNAPRKNV